jgi:hypothetical protein
MQIQNGTFLQDVIFGTLGAVGGRCLGVGLSVSLVLCLRFACVCDTLAIGKFFDRCETLSAILQ